MSTPKEIYDKVCNGDGLTDQELDKGIDHFCRLSELCYASGPVFRLTGMEANRVRQQLESFRNARRKNK